MCESCAGHSPKHSNPIRIWRRSEAPAELQALLEPLHGSFLAELVAIVPDEFQVPNFMDALGHLATVSIKHPSMEGVRVLAGGSLIQPRHSALWDKSKRTALAAARCV